MTDSSYYLAWLIYIVACGGVSFLTWKLLKPWIDLSVRHVIIPMLVILLTPYFSDPGKSRLAPAILTSLFEGLLGDKKIAMNALFAIGVLLVFWFLIVFALRFRRSSIPPNRLQ